MAARKAETITLKVDHSLAAAMRGIENRSEFIRNAIRAALDNTCPLCAGTGTLTPDQQRHWREFSRTHVLDECAECRAMVLVCSVAEKGHGSGPHRVMS